MDKTEPGNIKPRGMNTGEIAGLYGVCYRTLKKWIEPFKTDIGELTPRSNMYTPAQVKKIFEKIGEP